MVFTSAAWAPDFCFLSHLSQYKQKYSIPRQMFTCQECHGSLTMKEIIMGKHNIMGNTYTEITL